MLHAEFGVAPDLVLDADLLDIRGHYAPPGQAFLVACTADAAIVATAGLRRLDASRCEIKRMYVVAPQRGRGLGTRVLAALLNQARAAGYAEAWLDTREEMLAANRLYRRFSFEPAPDYNGSPRADRFMVLPLR